MVETLYSALLALSAFCLGACPFSLWIGHWFLRKDIRDYADGNPGAANVLRAGGRWSFVLALVSDIGKGAPFVVLADRLGFPEAVAMAVGLAAIMGHAFSPLLGFKGGKSIAVTAGVLFALPQHEMPLVFAVFMLAGFLFVESSAWTVVLATAASAACLAVITGGFWEPLFMLCVLAIFAVKQFGELRAVPRVKVKPVYWFQSRRHV